MNTTRKTSLWIAGILTVAGIVVFSMTFVRAVIYAPDGSAVSVPAQASAAVADLSVPGELPSRLVIPALSIDAHVQDVGVNSAGNMLAPNNFTDVAWYEYGTKPGQLGSAVMAGHVDNGLSLAGVFKHLSDIKPGDDIYVTSETGTILHFVVSSVDSFDYKNAPIEQIFEQKDKAYLKLLTCTGAWVQSDRTYDHRLVVTAVLAQP